MYWIDNLVQKGIRIYMITNERIGCPNVERKAYIFYNAPFDHSINICIGEFIEQENDAGEVQYLHRFYYDEIPDYLVDIIDFPGIDISLREKEFVRSGGIPYYAECSTIADCWTDKKYWWSRVCLDYDDKFEYMLRTRAITQKTNCYLGRYKENKVDLFEYKKWGDYQKSIFPNLDERPENVFHEIEN